MSDRLLRRFSIKTSNVLTVFCLGGYLWSSVGFLFWLCGPRVSTLDRFGSIVAALWCSRGVFEDSLARPWVPNCTRKWFRHTTEHTKPPSKRPKCSRCARRRLQRVSSRSAGMCLCGKNMINSASATEAPIWQTFIENVVPEVLKLQLCATIFRLWVPFSHIV